MLIDKRITGLVASYDRILEANVKLRSRRLIQDTEARLNTWTQGTT